jgi:hypothetical protein
MLRILSRPVPIDDETSMSSYVWRALPDFIQFPQVIGCYEYGHWSTNPQIARANIVCWRRHKARLLRNCPPSRGNSNLPAEIRYALSVVVSGRRTIKKRKESRILATV